MRTTVLTRVLVVTGIGALAAVPFMGVNEFWVFFITVTILQTMLLASLNLSLGYAGLFSLGHTALYAIGGYATAYFTVARGLPVGFGIVAGMVFGALAGIALSVPAYRTRTVYFAIITLAFLQLTAETVSKWPALGAFRGFPNIPGFSIAGQALDRNGYFWFALGVFVLTMGIIQQLASSALGRTFVAIRENEAAAASLGIGVFKTKLLNLGVSGALAGLAGALFAHLSGGIFPEAAAFNGGIRLFVAIIVGGVGWFAGPLLGMGVVAAVDRLTINLTTIQPALFIALLFASLAVMRINGIAGSVILSRFGRFFMRLPNIDAEVSEQVARPVEMLIETGPDGTGPLLQVHEIAKRFGGVQALDGVSLTVERGTIHGLIGPNGSGKSTFVNLVSGTMRADRGRIRFNGAEYPTPKPHVMAKAGLVRIFQRAEPFGRLLVIQNVLMGLHMRSDRNMLRCMVPLPSRRRQERALAAEAFAILDAAGLAHRALEPVATLPYGEQRLLEVARAIAARPKLLVLDEPATGLTSQELERLGDLLKGLRRGGLTILIIEHNMEFLMDLVDTVTVFDSGRVIAVGDPKVVQTHPDVVEAYLGEPVPA